ncbi:hypothetical protein TNCV_2863591 [Trichonephila clavipes]|nr:hypothetical protein TNCV_2863591 [Trichonephila clavipes]
MRLARARLAQSAEQESRGRGKLSIQAKEIAQSAEHENSWVRAPRWAKHLIEMKDVRYQKTKEKQNAPARLAQSAEHETQSRGRGFEFHVGRNILLRFQSKSRDLFACFKKEKK